MRNGISYIQLRAAFWFGNQDLTVTFRVNLERHHRKAY
jgi:hypothetical protein